MLDGVFAFVLYDTRNRTYMAARDAIGVNPLYIGWGGDGRRPPPHLSAGSPCAARSRFCSRRPACAFGFRQSVAGSQAQAGLAHTTIRIDDRSIFASSRLPLQVPSGSPPR